ncbi:ABC transporter ATP-binding protein [Marinicrinis sediminis]|uniref:ATP-binding cassette domain-containing protein n=1 Tax=Marinicrinis sediminis TaxID=1652465 RepID=A0ABW5R7V8_9BACL
MIELKNVTKDYKIVKKKPGLRGAVQSLFSHEYEIKTAVNGLSFSISEGELVGFIGANGAGKSTTIKMLCGILTPSSGEIRVNELVPYQQRQKNAKRIGVVFGQRSQLMWDIAVEESFDLLKHIYDIPEEIYQQNVKEFSEILNLTPLLRMPVRKLSLGQKMRCELAAAFLHNPAIVYLDEPTIGLDVAVKRRIRAFIREMNARMQTTVILTTHDMQDIEEICKRIIIIDDGNLLYDGPIASIRERFGHKRIIQFDIEEEQAVLPSELAPHVQFEFDAPSRKVSLTFQNEDISASHVIGLMLQQYRVLDLTMQDTDIESIVRDIYERGV